MSRLHEFIVTEAEAGRRLSSVLMKGRGVSRRLVRRVIANDTFYLNGQPVPLSVHVAAGDRITFVMPEASESVTPEPMPLDICYEDDDVIAINKPAGVLTHPTARERTGSLLAGVAYHLQKEGRTPHAVHRLDKFTSGAILYAKHTHAHHRLDQALRNGRVHRRYMALAYVPFDVPMGQWLRMEDRIVQDPEKPSRRVIGTQDEGDLAVTHAMPIARVNHMMLFLFRLETGRTHQIRLQMASRGMPLVGDRDYTFAYANIGDPVGKAAYYERVFPHQALHAYELSWQVQVDGDLRVAYASVPQALEELWALSGGKQPLAEWLRSTPSNQPSERN
ncbi:pseudouridine synthase [Alicyclobacillus acidiphilus]|uniref:pseudouridine synthase n=1 Tax=Alicyclobacillus acidiphilus TaxID=182455 RepID=UPI001FE14F96|nr:RluA family pseudouridine synthase [Alicyclobacillus acidiphilus]